MLISLLQNKRFEHHCEGSRKEAVRRITVSHSNNLIERLNYVRLMLIRLLQSCCLDAAAKNYIQIVFYKKDLLPIISGGAFVSCK